MKNNDPKKTFFDTILQQSSTSQQPDPPQSSSKPSPKNPFFLLGFVAGMFLFSYGLYLGLEVLHEKVLSFPLFSYMDTLKLYIGTWVIVNLFRKK